jgi:MSHA biogenesis protein MshJ
MQMNLLQMLNRLEALSLRERAMVLLGAPLVLLAAGELLVFGPAAKQAAEAQKQTEVQQTELKALSAALAAQPAVAALPGADQLLRQRSELQGQIDAARAIMASVDQSVDWGTVVRATVAGTPGLTLTQLKTMPADVVFTPSMVKPAAAPAARPGVAGAKASAPAPVPASRVTAAPPPGAGEAIYRHRAELTVKGDFGALLSYLQTLQRVPGDLRWDRLQLSAAAYPQASVQLTLHTLSNRAETPFN